MSLRVIVEDLVASAVAVTGHGEDLAAAFGGADGRVEAAQSGWQGRSAVALAGLAERWASEGRSVVARMADHAVRLHVSAGEFWAQDQGGAAAVDSVW